MIHDFRNSFFGQNYAFRRIFHEFRQAIKKGSSSGGTLTLIDAGKNRLDGFPVEPGSAEPLSCLGFAFRVKDIRDLNAGAARVLNRNKRFHLLTAQTVGDQFHIKIGRYVHFRNVRKTGDVIQSLLFHETREQNQIRRDRVIAVGAVQSLGIICPVHEDGAVTRRFCERSDGCSFLYLNGFGKFRCAALFRACRLRQRERYFVGCKLMLVL